MVRELTISKELQALFDRAELASARARRLLDENERWRRSVLQQLDYMLELGTELKRTPRPTLLQQGRIK